MKTPTKREMKRAVRLLWPEGQVILNEERRGWDKTYRIHVWVQGHGAAFEALSPTRAGARKMLLAAFRVRP